MLNGRGIIKNKGAGCKTHFQNQKGTGWPGVDALCQQTWAIRYTIAHRQIFVAEDSVLGHRMGFPIDSQSARVSGSNRGYLDPSFCTIANDLATC